MAGTLSTVTMSSSERQDQNLGQTTKTTPPRTRILMTVVSPDPQQTTPRIPLSLPVLLKVPHLMTSPSRMAMSSAIQNLQRNHPHTGKAPITGALLTMKIHGALPQLKSTLTITIK